MIGRFPGETSCLTLVWAVLDLYITTPRTASDSANSNTNTCAASDTPEANQRRPGGERRLDWPPPGTKLRRIYSSNGTPPLLVVEAVAQIVKMGFGVWPGV
jgi:hypothetical protein